MGAVWAEFMTTSIDSLPTAKLNKQCNLVITESHGQRCTERANS